MLIFYCRPCIAAVPYLNLHNTSGELVPLNTEVMVGFLQMVLGSPDDIVKAIGLAEDTAKVIDNPADFAKVIGNPADSAKLIGNPADSVRVVRNPADSVRVVGNPADSVRVVGNPADSLKLVGNPENSERVVGIPPDSVMVVGSPKNTAKVADLYKLVEVEHLPDKCLVVVGHSAILAVVHFDNLVVVPLHNHCLRHHRYPYFPLLECCQPSHQEADHQGLLQPLV